MNAISPQFQRENSFLNEKTPGARFGWALHQYDRPVLTTSFGDQAVASIELWAQAAQEAGKRADVVSVDTHTIHPGTILYAAELAKLYGDTLDFHIYKADVSALELVMKHGEFWKDEKTLQDINKTVKDAPLERAFKDLGATAWVTGLVRDETMTDRRGTQIMEYSQKFQLPKISPLADKSKRSVQGFINDLNLPVNGVGVTEWYRHVDFGDGAKIACGIHVEPPEYEI